MKALKYSDIVLVPSYTECESRSSCDTSVDILGKRYRLPVIPANMRAVINEKHCEWLSQNDYFYIMHRFDVDIIKFVQRANANNWRCISISIGVKKEDHELILQLASLKLNVDYITVDIAHGHSKSMKNMLSHIKRCLPNTKIIAGNVATPRAVEDLANWGADIVKVGIGQGSPCTTKDKTGFTMPMFTCVKNCSDVYQGNAFSEDLTRVPIIADGGVASNGDIAKALVAGADLVMAGGLFASCTDSPSHSIDIGGVIHKAYFGSASIQNKKSRTHIEGTLKHVAGCGLSLKDKAIEIQEDLQSAISYAGGDDLSVLNPRDVEIMEV